MKFNSVLIIASLIFTTIPTFAQTTYFIKYKSNVPIDVVESNIAEQILSNNLGDAPLALPTYDMNYLAKGLGRGDEVLGRIIKIQFLENVDEVNFKSILSSDPNIEYIQKANTYQVDLIPNDSLLSQQWALEKIKAFDAWDITTGVDTVLLAIIDTGIEYFHPDLKNKIYNNSGEIGIDNLGKDKNSNGIDDDNNGFIDDYMGWDFVDRAGFPLDTTGGDFLNWDNNPYDKVAGNLGYHGTFVGGIAGAEVNNISGIAGAAPNIKLLNIRALDNAGNGEEDDAAAGIIYAVKMGAKVISMSWGDYKFSFVLRDVIRYAYSQNVVLVGSSGNSGSSVLIKAPHYPSGYTEVISVGNSTQNDYRSSNSVYGSTLDLMAPGTDILSTTVNGDYVPAGGTSASAPLVAGTAALILSLQDFTNEEVKQILKSTTDDIGEAGWDEQTGSGRLNMERALRVLAPSNIKFNFPTMDYGTFSDTLIINANVLSAYFVNYRLEIGTGYIPEDWSLLIENGLNQFFGEAVYTLNLSNFAEGSYTLRLVVNSNNGRPTEERVTFHIMRTAPKVVEVGLGSLYYGDQSTIAGEYYTNQPSIMKMYYRKEGESNFNFISMDGFATNNQFVKQYHYGFIPKDLVSPSTNYEVYFEAINLAGLKTVVIDSTNGVDYFNITTDDVPRLTSYQEMPFSMPNSNVWDKPVSFLSDNFNEILLQLYYNTPITYFGLYKLEDNQFIKVDSLAGKFPRAFGDFNNNGQKDFISFKNPNNIIDEQITQNSFNLSEKYNDSGSLLENVVLVDDLDSDGTFEIISQKNNSSYEIRKIKSDLSVDTSKIVLYNAYADTLDFDRVYGYNNYIFNNIEVTDANNDGIKEIWFVDADGDLISYNINSLNNISKGDSLRTVGLSTTSLKDHSFSVGDYNGDGKKDFAILYETNSIAPTYLLLVVTFDNHIPQILFNKVFLDQSDEYVGGISFNNIYQSLKFVDLDNDNSTELVFNIFPYSYIFRYSAGLNDMIFFDEGSNTARVFTGDLNQNMVPEIGLLLNEKLKFLEFSNSNRTALPSFVKGFSISSDTVQLSWVSDSPKFYIYKGLNRNNLELVDSINVTTYDSKLLHDSTYYYYAVKAYDSSKPEPLSGMSNIIEVYSHTPGKPINAKSNSNRSVIVTFSEKMKNTIENLQSFEIPNVGYPNSITASDQKSYLLSFNQNLPAGEQKVIVQNIKDFYDSPIATDSLTFVVSLIPEVETFFISSSEIVNSYKIKVSFNYPVDVATATIATNYTFEPHNKVTTVSVDPNDSKTIYLDLSGQKPVGSIGKEYILRVINITSDAITGNIPIETGAGSYHVLTAFAKDLSDVYVYPNPSKQGSEKITFANLPQRAKITIWTIDGKLINEIEETDGNGGVDYTLTDFDGKQISSGIYFYRIVQLDEASSEGEEKLGKFAIVR